MFLGLTITNVVKYVLLIVINVWHVDVIGLYLNYDTVCGGSCLFFCLSRSFVISKNFNQSNSNKIMNSSSTTLLLKFYVSITSEKFIYKS